MKTEFVEGSGFGDDISDSTKYAINTLSPELNPICYLLALLAHDFLHVSRMRVKRNLCPFLE
jgi:transposase